MSTIRTLRTVSAASAALLLVGAAYGQTHTSAGTGNWNNTATWNEGTVPTASSTVAINSGHVVTITDARQVTSVTVNNGQLKIDGTSGTPAELEFPASASSPSMSLAAADDLYLVDYARVEVQQDMTWSNSSAGSVKADAYASCEIAIGNPSSASNVTLTVNVPVSGQLKFIGIGTGNHSDGLSFAAVAITLPNSGSLEFAASLESVSGGNYVLGDSATLYVYESVSTTGNLQMGANATIDVDPPGLQTSFSYAGSFTGSCSTPTSPIQDDFTCATG